MERLEKELLALPLTPRALRAMGINTDKTGKVCQKYFRWNRFLI